MSQPSLYDLEEEVRYLKASYALHKPTGLSAGTQSRNVMGALLLHFADLGSTSTAPPSGVGGTESGGVLSRASSFRGAGGRSPQNPRPLPPPTAVVNRRELHSPTASEASLRRHHSNLRHNRSSPTDPSLLSTPTDHFSPKSPAMALTGDSVEEEANSAVGALDSLDEYLTQWRDEADRRKQRSLRAAGGAAPPPGATRSAAELPPAAVPAASQKPGRKGKTTSFVGV